MKGAPGSLALISPAVPARGLGTEEKNELLLYKSIWLMPFLLLHLPGAGTIYDPSLVPASSTEGPGNKWNSLLSSPHGRYFSCPHFTAKEGSERVTGPGPP